MTEIVYAEDNAGWVLAGYLVAGAVLLLVLALGIVFLIMVELPRRVLETRARRRVQKTILR